MVYTSDCHDLTTIGKSNTIYISLLTVIKEYSDAISAFNRPSTC